MLPRVFPLSKEVSFRYKIEFVFLKGRYILTRTFSTPVRGIVGVQKKQSDAAVQTEIVVDDGLLSGTVARNLSPVKDYVDKTAGGESLEVNVQSNL